MFVYCFWEAERYSLALSLPEERRNAKYAGTVSTHISSEENTIRKNTIRSPDRLRPEQGTGFGGEESSHDAM